MHFVLMNYEIEGFHERFRVDFAAIGFDFRLFVEEEIFRNDIEKQEFFLELIWVASNPEQDLIGFSRI